MVGKGVGTYRPNSSRFPAANNRQSAAEQRPKTAAVPTTTEAAPGPELDWKVTRATVTYAKKPSITGTRRAKDGAFLGLPKRKASKSASPSVPNSTKQSTSEMANEEDNDPIGWRLYTKGSLNCPSHKNPQKLGRRCQLWRVPQPKPVHNPVWRRGKFINDHYHFICPTQDLFCPNCELYFHSYSDYHHHLLTMDSLKPLHDVLEIYEKENERIQIQIRRHTIGGQNLKLLRQKQKKELSTTPKQYYCPSTASDIIRSTKDKIEKVRDANLLAEMNRVMAKKENSLINLRKKTEEKIGRITRQLTSARDKLDMLVEANKDPETKTSDILKQERKVKNLSDQLATVTKDEKAIETKKQQSVTNHQRKLSKRMSRIDSNSNESNMSLARGSRSALPGKIPSGILERRSSSSLGSRESVRSFVLSEHNLPVL